MGIDFDGAFEKGHKSYDAVVGDWWHVKTADGPHRRAYRNIADYVLKTFRDANRPLPRMFVDYACGNGALLKVLAKAMPDTVFIGLDGSEPMLKRAALQLTKAGNEADFVSTPNAFRKKGPRIRLVCASLPNFALPPGKVDAAVFAFPNISMTQAQMKQLRRNGHFPGPRSLAIARLLSRLKDGRPGYDTDEPEDIYVEILEMRIIAENIRQFLKRNGMWFEVEYSNISRQELGTLDQWRMLFSEAALEAYLKNKKLKQHYRLDRSHYFRSSVILDVYDQTQDPEDRSGGYIISAFVAR